MVKLYRKWISPLKRQLAGFIDLFEYMVQALEKYGAKGFDLGHKEDSKI